MSRGDDAGLVRARACTIRGAAPLRIVAAAALLTAPGLQARASLGPVDVQSRLEVLHEEVEYANGDVELAATLSRPVTEDLVPAVVIVHGSGDSDRSNAWTAAYAASFLARGIAVLHPDKRGSGKSGGDWRDASFEELARDAIAGVELLREMPEIDGERVGLVGFSQGGAIAAVAAAQSSACRFVITISGSTLPLLDQILDEIEMEGARAGTPLGDAESKRLRELYVEAMACARSGEGFGELAERVAAARASSPAMTSALRTLPTTPDHWAWRWMTKVGEFDPLPAWQRLTQPAMVVFGGRDERIRVRESAQRLLDAIGGRGRDVTVLHFEKNGHALHREDLLDLLARWIRELGTA